MTHHPTSPAQIIAGPSAIPQRMRGSVRGGLRGGGLSKRPDQTSDRRDRREIRRRDRPVGNLDGKISFDREYEPEFAIDRPVAQALYDIGNLRFRL
jgi:hypothetical protein